MRRNVQQPGSAENMQQNSDNESEDNYEDNKNFSPPNTKSKIQFNERRSIFRSPWFIILVALLAIIIVIVLLSIVVGVILYSNDVKSSSTTANNLSDLPSDPLERAKALLQSYPVIDGHNDLPLQIRNLFKNRLGEFDLEDSTIDYGWDTDIPRLKEGIVGAQFWSAYMNCSTQYYDATRTFIDQIDVIKRMVTKYTDTFELALTADDIERAYYQNNKIASLIGVEGGHAIDSSMGTLRSMYDLGARYMTLTHTCNTPWADCANGPETIGLSDFGIKVVREMNRLGMMVDISHVSPLVMSQALDHSLAPVIFSHSSAYALCNNVRNVPDYILRRMPQNGGIVMVNFFPMFVNCSMSATLEQVADHVDHIKQVAGVDYIGVGSDFDGIPTVPVGLEDVSKFPALFAELISRGYTDDEVTKISYRNLIRVFKQVEKVRDELISSINPDDSLIDPQPDETCRPDF